jgi:glutamate-ammonia-ligase adenylyltransferase
LQLVHATADASVLHPNTLTALRALAAKNCLAAEDAERLEAAARLYQNVTQVLRLTVEGVVNAAEASTSLRNLIARVAGYPSFEEVEVALSGIERDVRARFGALIGPIAP